MDPHLNNLLGRSSSDSTPVAFMPWDTLHARVTQGIVAGAVGDLLILRAVNNLSRQQEDIFRANRELQERARYEESKRAIGEERERADAAGLAAQRLHARTPPLERMPGESEAVFQLKAEARAEFLREFAR